MKIINKITSGILLAVVAQTASAEMTFNISSTGHNQADRGFQMAAETISAIFSDDVTVNISASFASLGAGILGQASTVKNFVDYGLWKDALSSDVSSANDAVLASYLPQGNDFSVLINNTSDNPYGYLSSQAYLDNDGGANNNTVNISKANAKALGLYDANDETTDASIAFSSDYAFDFDPTDGIESGHIDFVGVAMHEMFHSLGFYSGVDILDYYTGEGPASSVYSDNVFKYVSPLDFLRHSDESIALGAALDFTADTRAKHLSLDGGITIIQPSAFSKGRYNGDGHQASHWADHKGIGGMDPTASIAGSLMTFSANDYLAMDVIGWDFNSEITESVPLPASAVLLSLGMLGFSRRRK